MINKVTGKVYGSHKDTAAASGTQWRVHYIGGGMSMTADTDTVFSSLRGCKDYIFVENMSMRPYIDTCLQLMQAGHSFVNYKGMPLWHCDGSYYIGERQADELNVRRDLQVYYSMHKEAYIVDKAYIEDKMGSAV